MHFSHSCDLPPSLFLSLPLKILVLCILCVSDYSTIIFSTCLSRILFPCLSYLFSVMLFILMLKAQPLCIRADSHPKDSFE